MALIDDRKNIQSIGQSRLLLENRRNLSISGVRDVESFDESQVTLFTELGMLTIAGDDLRINKLSIDIGEVEIEGEIYAFEYSDDEPSSKGQGFLSRLFK